MQEAEANFEPIVEEEGGEGEHRRKLESPAPQETKEGQREQESPAPQETKKRQREAGSPASPGAEAKEGQQREEL